MLLAILNKNFVPENVGDRGFKCIFDSDFFNKAQENSKMTITGNRFKRSEGIVFKILYEIYNCVSRSSRDSSLDFI